MKKLANASELAVQFLSLGCQAPSVEISGMMPSAFKELCCPINSNSSKYYESVTYTIVSECESMNAAS